MIHTSMNVRTLMSTRKGSTLIERDGRLYLTRRKGLRLVSSSKGRRLVSTRKQRRLISRRNSRTLISTIFLKEMLFSGLMSGLLCGRAKAKCPGRTLGLVLG